jgi:AGZA family xanthine/uracil permease-like MFS transporter
VTYFPHDQPGDDRWDYFKKVAYFHPIDHTLNTLDWNVGQHTSQFVLALFTFLYVDIIDCTATLYAMARFCGAVDPEDGDFPRSTLAYCTDAFCISVGALLGVSPVTAYIESGAGIAEGGKTGLTAITSGLCFIIAMFFAPIFASIPPWATGSTLVIVSTPPLATSSPNMHTGRLLDDATSYKHQLEIHRRRHSCIRYTHVYPFQLQRSLWSDCRSHDLHGA